MYFFDDKLQKGCLFLISIEYNSWCNNRNSQDRMPVDPPRSTLEGKFTFGSFFLYVIN